MKKAYISTFGCKVNQYEAQALREQFARQGYRYTAAIEEADIILVNTCTVTGEADRQCRQLVRQALRKNGRAQIIITGCYAARASEEIERISPRVTVVRDKSGIFAGDKPPASIREFSGHARAFVKIQDGCDAFCSYCIVPFVRSRLWSKPEEEVIGEIRELVGQGYAEIVLSGVRLGRYDGGLVRLLSRIADVPGAFRIRLSSLEMREVSPELLNCMRANQKKICAHLHLPLQSASDGVLRRMNRPYSASQFGAVVERTYHCLPDAGISTDVIVGFPGETEDDFKKTRDFLDKYRFSRLHVFKYSLRNETKAAGFSDHISPAVATERSQILKELDSRLQADFWRRFIGSHRPAIREGTKNTVLTDNYIRLSVDSDSISNSIATFQIRERNGQPWGVKIA